MTTQETTDSLVQRFRAALGDRETAAREWERQAQQMSTSLIAERAAHEASKARVAELERQLGAAHERIGELEEQARIVILSALAYTDAVLLVDAAALDALGRVVNNQSTS